MRIRVFISSVQKELLDERMALQILLSTDPFLAGHCVPVLFEEQPAGLQPKAQAYLELLRTCHVYLGIVWKEYGRSVDGLSATHHEYRLAQELKLPTLMTIKGDSDLGRAAETEEFIKEIKSDNHTYERFEDVEVLQERVRARLIKHIKDNYDLEPTLEQDSSARQTIRVASSFERQRLDSVSWDELDMDIAALMVSGAEEWPVENFSRETVRRTL
nr:DUF4062 domain-containing protein [uncultured Fretibacterium sp.]